MGEPHREIVSVYLFSKDIDSRQLHIQAEEIDEVALVPIPDFERGLKAKEAKYYPQPEEYERILPLLKAARLRGTQQKKNP